MLNEILKDVSDYLEWEREEGTVHVEVSPDVLEALTDMSRTKPQTTNPLVQSAPSSPKTKAAKAAPLSVALPAVELPPLDAGAPFALLQAVAADIAGCTRCVLHEGRTNTVPGQGNPQPEILFVGEAPGRDEDEQGLAFVGRAGQLLTKMIEAMGLTREDVFIANINKCRPPDNRKPTPEEMNTCLPFLKRQIVILRPKVIIAMGATAVEGLVTLPEGQTISKVRGEWLAFEGIPLMPTYHPAYMLRNPAMKRPVWEDLKTVLRYLGRPVPVVKKADS